MRSLPRFWLLSLLALACARFAPAAPVSQAGEKLAAFYDSMRVEEFWLSGAIVAWRTGEPTGQPITDGGKHTHCSQFAAATAERLGIYLLRPPEHSSKFLANAQYDWLAVDGAQKGWEPVPDAATAQLKANSGFLVVAVYKNEDAKKSGHIALIRPSDKRDDLLAAEGPQVTQAGGTNSSSTTLKKGFANHRDAFSGGKIRFFSHATKFSAGD